MTKDYLELTRLIERLHRRFLDVLRTELKRMGVRDLNGVQALLLQNIGREEIAIRDLVERGYYQGSNVSYNVKKLTELGYLEQRRAEHDRRSVMIRLTAKALDVVAGLRDLEARNSKQFAQALRGGIPLGQACGLLHDLERVWSDHVRFGNDA